MLQALPVTPDFITEYSTMERELCVELTSIRAGLERSVHLNITFSPQGYSRLSKCPLLCHMGLDTGVKG